MDNKEYYRLHSKKTYYKKQVINIQNELLSDPINTTELQAKLTLLNIKIRDIEKLLLIHKKI